MQKEGIALSTELSTGLRSFAIVAAIMATSALVSEDCFAVPAFARKYRMSCTTCHAPAPRLKAYGEQFAKNGYKLEGKEPTRYYFETGDSLLALARELPLAIRFDAYATYVLRGGEDETDLETPYGIKLMSGGNISKSVFYYLYFYMSERGEITGLEDAFIGFDNLFGLDLDVMVGQFQVSDPLFKRELRLTLEDYEIYRARVGNARTNLTYDRGLIVAYTAPFGTDLTAMVVNGSGIGEAGEFFDDDDWKNVMLRVSHSLGNLRLGAFGYFCNAHVRSDERVVWNEHNYLGIDATVDLGSSLQLNAQYLERTDENPLFEYANADRILTRGGFVELYWALKGELGRQFVTFLYNYVDSDFESLNYRSEALNFSYLLRRNLRVSTELRYREVEDDWRLSTGFVSAF